MADIAKLLEEIDSLTVIELSELVKGIEEKYGVSAQAVAAPVAGGAAAAAEEKSSFNVVLKEVGAKTITLGQRILRTETASIVVISNIIYELEM